jgi:hypothetical protein
VKNVLFGAASTRFHRPTSGQGLNENAQAVIKSMRSYIEKSDFFNGQPANQLLGNRNAGEAFCRAIPDREYAIFFPKGGEVELDINEKLKDISIEWLDIMKSEWISDSNIRREGGKLIVKSPGAINWLAHIKIK